MSFPDKGTADTSPKKRTKRIIAAHFLDEHMTVSIIVSLKFFLRFRELVECDSSICDKSSNRHCRSQYVKQLDGCRLRIRSEEHTSELQSRFDLVCRLLLE